MPRLALTLAQIRENTAPKSYTRGEGLYLNQAISETVLRGNVIEGTCEAGSQPEPYHVQASLNDKGVVDASCNCLYEFGGYCKHVVALLLTYLNNPDQFESRAPLADVLESRDKNELIAVIRQMLKIHPDLKSLLDRPTPSKANVDAPVNTQAYRKELRRALKQEREWGKAGAEMTVDSIVEAAQEFAIADDWRSASSIYRMIIEEALANLDYFYEDEEGYYAASIDQVVDILGECLENLDTDADRKAILESLMNIYLADIDVGDVGANAPDLILRYAHQEDIASLRSRVEAARKKEALKDYSDWTVKSYTKFIAELDLLDNVDPETVLTRLRDEGMYSVLVSKLLELKRVDEAVSVIREHLKQADARIQALQRLIMNGCRDIALQLAEETLKDRYESSIAGWLIDVVYAQGNLEVLFRWQLERMKVEPTIEYYAELKNTAQQLGNWLLVRPAVIEQLENGKRYATLTRVYMLEMEWDKAWATLPDALKNRDPYRYNEQHHLELDVAQATLQTHPEKALPVFIHAARAAIDLRNREAYREAANFLRQVRDTYDSIDEYERWEKLIASIRRDFPKLTALHDELKKAGL